MEKLEKHINKHFPNGVYIFQCPNCRSQYAFATEEIIIKDNRKYTKCIGCEKLIDITNNL